MKRESGQAAVETALTMPLLLFFSTPGCPYCLDVRRNYLAPRAREGKAAGVIVREVDITSRRSLTGRESADRPARQLAHPGLQHSRLPDEWVHP